MHNSNGKPSSSRGLSDQHILSKKSKKPIIQSEDLERSPPYQWVAMPDDIIARYPETINKLTNLELGHDFERLSGWSLNGAPVISMRTNDKIRLICTYVDIDGKTALTFYKEQDDHNYEKTKKSIIARNRHGNVDNDQLLRGKALLPVVTAPEKNAVFETTKAEQLAIKANKASYRSVYFQKHYIYLDDTQEKVLLKTEQWPLVISGPPGSGKSCATAGLLASWLREAKEQNIYQIENLHSGMPNVTGRSTDLFVSAPASSNDDAIAPKDQTMFAYVTESTDLHHLMRNNMASQPGLEGLYQHIRFSNYNDILRAADSSTQGKTFLTKAESKQRFFEHDDLQLFLKALQVTQTTTKSKKARGKGKATKQATIKFHADDKLKQKLYQEALNIAGCISLEEYLTRQGQRTSQFFDCSVKVRTELYNAFQTYLANLGKANIVDPLLYRPKNPLALRFLGMTIDEAQDYVPVQTWVLKQLALDDHIAYCVDTHQNIGAATANSIRDYLRNRLHADNISFNDSYRCPNNIIDIANVALILKNHIKGGLADTDDYPKIIRSEKTREQSKSGYVTLNYTKPYKLDKTGKPIRYLPEGEALEKLKAEVQGNVAVAIVTHEDLVEELRRLLGHPLVFSPTQIKGLEFNKIITWDLLRDSRFVEANKVLPANPLDESQIKNRGKEKTINVEQSNNIIALCELFTALSRSTGQLHFNEPDAKHHLGKILGALQTTIDKFPLNSLDDVNKPTPSTPEAWQAVMNQLIRQENDNAAMLIWQNDAIWVGATESRTDSFETYRCRLLDLPSPAKKVKATTSTTPLHVPPTPSSSSSKKTPPTKPGAKTTAKVSTVNQKAHVTKATSNKTLSSTVNPAAVEAKPAALNLQNLLAQARKDGWEAVIRKTHFAAAQQVMNTLTLIDLDITSPIAYRSRREGIKQLFNLAKSAMACYTAKTTSKQEDILPFEMLLVSQKRIIDDIEAWIRESTKEQLQTLFANGDMLFLFASSPILLPLLTTLLKDIPALKEVITSTALLRKKLIPGDNKLKLSAFDLLKTSELGVNVLSFITEDNLARLEEETSQHHLGIVGNAITEVIQAPSAISIANKFVLHEAARNGDVSLIRGLLTDSHAVDINAKDDTNWTPLHYACHHGHLGAIKLLLQHGAEPDAVGDDGLTPIALALSPPSSAEVKTQPLFEIVRACHQAGANIHWVDKQNDRTLLHYIALHEDSNYDNVAPVIQYLIDNGLSINQPDKNQLTPLLTTVYVSKEKISQLFISEWANLDARDKRGLTPLNIAAIDENRHIVTSLIANGANLNIPSANETKLTTPLHNAVIKEHREIMMALLRAGAAVDPKDHEGLTPLHLATNNENIDAVRILLNFGANPNIQEDRDNHMTPVHLAVYKRRYKILEALLASNRVNLNITEDLGSTALDVAQYLKDETMIEMLKRYGAKESSSRGRSAASNNIIQASTSTTAPSQSPSPAQSAPSVPLALDWGKILHGQAKSKGWEATILGVVQLNNPQIQLALSKLNLVDFDITSPPRCENRREGIKQLFMLAKSMLAASNPVEVGSTSNTSVTVSSKQAWEILLQYNDNIISDISAWINESSLDESLGELSRLFYNGDMLLLLCSTPKLLSVFVPILVNIPRLGETMTDDTLFRKKWLLSVGTEEADITESCLADLLINNEFGIKLFCHLLQTNTRLFSEQHEELFETLRLLDEYKVKYVNEDIIKTMEKNLKIFLQLMRSRWGLKINQDEQDDEYGSYDSDDECQFNSESVFEPLFSCVYDENPGRFKRLLIQGSTLAVKDLTAGNTVLHKASQRVADCMSAIIDICVREWVHLDAQDKFGNTALHIAAYAPDCGLNVSQLLACGANPNVRNSANRTPLRDAYSKNHMDSFNRLLACPRTDINALWTLEQKPGFQQGTQLMLPPLHQAILDNNVAVVKRLLEIPRLDVNAKTVDGFTPLHLAVQKRRLDIVALILKRQDLRIDEPDNTQGCSALHMAVTIYRAVREDNEVTRLELVKMLISHNHNANVNFQAQQAQNYTPLMLAIMHEQVQALTYMLETGKVDLSLRDKTGKTAKELAQAGRSIHSKRALADFERRQKSQARLTPSSSGLFAPTTDRETNRSTKPAKKP